MAGPAGRIRDASTTRAIENGGGAAVALHVYIAECNLAGSTAQELLRRLRMRSNHSATPTNNNPIKRMR